MKYFISYNWGYRQRSGFGWVVVNDHRSNDRGGAYQSSQGHSRRNGRQVRHRSRGAHHPTFVLEAVLTKEEFAKIVKHGTHDEKRHAGSFLLSEALIILRSAGYSKKDILHVATELLDVLS